MAPNVLCDETNTNDVNVTIDSYNTKDVIFSLNIDEIDNYSYCNNIYEDSSSDEDSEDDSGSDSGSDSESGSDNDSEGSDSDGSDSSGNDSDDSDDSSNSSEGSTDDSDSDHEEEEKNLNPPIKNTEDDEDNKMISRILSAHMLRVIYKPRFTVFRLLETRAETRSLAFKVLMEKDVAPEKDVMEYHEMEENKLFNTPLEEDWRSNIIPDDKLSNLVNTDKYHQVDDLPKPLPRIQSLNKTNTKNTTSDDEWNIPWIQNVENLPPQNELEELSNLTKFETFTFKTPGISLMDTNIKKKEYTIKAFPFHRESSSTTGIPDKYHFNVTGTQHTDKLSQFKRIMDSYGNIL